MDPSTTVMQVPREYNALVFGVHELFELLKGFLTHFFDAQCGSQFALADLLIHACPQFFTTRMQHGLELRAPDVRANGIDTESLNLCTLARPIASLQQPQA